MSSLKTLPSSVLEVFMVFKHALHEADVSAVARLRCRCSDNTLGAAGWRALRGENIAVLLRPCSRMRGRSCELCDCAEVQTMSLHS